MRDRRTGLKLTESSLRPGRASVRSSRKVAGVPPGLASATLLIALLIGLPATAGQVSEQGVKAAFVANFARYLKWPSTAFEAASDPIVIGVYGDRHFCSVLKNVTTGREVGGRPLQVVEYSNLERTVDCHILFIGASQAGNHEHIIRMTKGSGVFTVSDSPGFAQAGGVANFVIVEKKVRFEINERAAEQAGVTVSSKLLRLAILMD